MTKRLHQKYIPYIFLSPFLLFFLVFRLWPILSSFYLSFFNYDGFSLMQFVGLKNYVDLISNSTFRTAIWNTVFFVAVYNFAMIFLAVVLAVLLSTQFVKFERVYRSIFFTPIGMSLPVVAMVFDLIFARNIGFIGAVANMLGKTYNIRWFADVDLAMWGILIMRIWRGFGYYSAYFLAALAGIPEDIYEAAKIDGAGFFKTFFKITLPLLKPMLLFVGVMSTILAFQIFDEPWIIAQGGPANSTLTLQIFLYRTTFLEGRYGMGSAVAYIMTILMMGASIVYVNRLSEKETQP